jgi:hypothetical protein
MKMDDVSKEFNELGTLPVFQNEKDLKKSRFFPYLQSVYGTDTNFAPSDFPLDFKTFDMFYLPLLKAVGLSPPVTRSIKACGDFKEYELYLNMSGFHDPPGSVFVWKSKSPKAAASASTWVEVTHCGNPNNHEAIAEMWCYIVKGSGNFVQVGKTKAYNDHPGAVADLLNKKCSDTECVQYFDALFTAAANSGLDSVQFTGHADMTCGNRATELVLVNIGAGAGTCPTKNMQRFASGWSHQHECKCDESKKCLSCFQFAAPGVPPSAPAPSAPAGHAWLWWLIPVSVIIGILFAFAVVPH